MALVFTPIDVQDVRGKYKARRCTGTIASYTVGGEAVTDTHALQVGFRRIVGIEFEDGASSTGHVWQFDESVPEVFVRESAAAASGLQEAGAENVGAITCTVYGE